MTKNLIRGKWYGSYPILPSRNPKLPCVPGRTLCIDPGGSLQEMGLHRSFIGLSLADMEQVTYIAWLGFYGIFSLLIKEEFRMSFGKATVIAFLPTLLVVMGKVLFY